MKKYIFILLLVGCSEDEPEFKIVSGDGVPLQSRFEKFVQIASDFDVTIPQNNLILRYTQDDNLSINDSRSHKDGDQLYIDIDQKFIAMVTDEDQFEFVLFQQLANGLVGTPFRDCGLMKRVVNLEDIPLNPQMDYGTYPNLFDPESACIE